MKPYQRHTEMTHHILAEDEEYKDWWYWEDCNEDCMEDNVNYDIIRKPSGKKLMIKISRWKHPFSSNLISEEFINEVDMKSFYPLQKKREITINEVLDEVEDSRNTFKFTQQQLFRIQASMLVENSNL